MACAPGSPMDVVMQQFPQSNYVFCEVLDGAHRSLVPRPWTHTPEADKDSDKMSQTTPATPPTPSTPPTPTSNPSPETTMKRRASGIFKNREANMQAAVAAEAASSGTVGPDAVTRPADAPATVLFVLGNSIVLFDVQAIDVCDRISLLCCLFMLAHRVSMTLLVMVRQSITSSVLKTPNVHSLTISASAIVAATSVTASVT